MNFPINTDYHRICKLVYNFIFRNSIFRSYWYLSSNCCFPKHIRLDIVVQKTIFPFNILHICMHQTIESGRNGWNVIWHFNLHADNVNRCFNLDISQCQCHLLMSISFLNVNVISQCQVSCRKFQDFCTLVERQSVSQELWTNTK